MAHERMNKDQAMAALHRCSRCGRWITTKDCDHCWVDLHLCQPPSGQARDAIDEIRRAAVRVQELQKKFPEWLGRPRVTSEGEE